MSRAPVWSVTSARLTFSLQSQLIQNFKLTALDVTRKMVITVLLGAIVACASGNLRLREQWCISRSDRKQQRGGGNDRKEYGPTDPQSRWGCQSSGKSVWSKTVPPRTKPETYAGRWCVQQGGTCCPDLVLTERVQARGDKNVRLPDKSTTRPRKVLKRADCGLGCWRHENCSSEQLRCSAHLAGSRGAGESKRAKRAGED